MTPDRRRRRRQLLVLYMAILEILLVVSLEVGARVMGHKPFSVERSKIRVDPGDRFFQAHPVLGHAHLPGDFKVTLGDGYSFKVSHATNTLRKTRSVEINANNRPSLWIMGCSFVHGWSLDDPATMPWRVQQAMPGYDVQNFGVNGYGTVHSLLQYREYRKTEAKPRFVVLNYAYFHDERSTLSRSWRKALATYNQLGEVTEPFARFDKTGSLAIKRAPLAYSEWPLQRYSAFIHLLEQRYCLYEWNVIKAREVSVALLKMFAEECRRDGVEFIVAGITRGNDTAHVLSACKSAGIQTVDISVNLSEPGSRNTPHDDHPSERSQAEYARRLSEFLKNHLSNALQP